MRILIRGIGLIVLLIVIAAAAVMARAPRAHKVSCKEIRNAVWANHTLDQIIKEFDTDAKRVMKCTQQQGKRRADKKSAAKKSPPAARHGATGGTSSSHGSPATTTRSTR